EAWRRGRRNLAASESFFGHDGYFRRKPPQSLDDDRFRFVICRRNRRSVGLAAHLDLRSVMPQDCRSGFPGEVQNGEEQGIEFLDRTHSNRTKFKTSADLIYRCSTFGGCDYMKGRRRSGSVANANP